MNFNELQAQGRIITAPEKTLARNYTRHFLKPEKFRTHAVVIRVPNGMPMFYAMQVEEGVSHFNTTLVLTDNPEAAYAWKGKRCAERAATLYNRTQHNVVIRIKDVQDEFDFAMMAQVLDV